MSLVIATNTIANAVRNTLTTNQANLQKSLARLSSGSKIVHPTDDAGGLSVATKLRATLNRNARTQQNVQNAISFLQVQDGALNQVSKILDRMSELKVMSLDPTKNSTDLDNYDTEFTQLQSQLVNIKAEDFNGIGLFNATNNLSVYTTEGGDANGEPTVTATRTGVFQDLGNTTIGGSTGPQSVSEYNDQVGYSQSTSAASVFVKSTNADGSVALALVASNGTGDNSITSAGHGGSYASELGNDLITINNVDKLYDSELGEARARVFEAGVSRHTAGEIVFDDTTGEFYLSAGDGTFASSSAAAATIDTNAGEFIKLGDFPSITDYDSFSTSEAYEVGDIVRDGDNLYVATASVAAGQQIPSNNNSFLQLSTYNQSGSDLLTSLNTLSNYSVADFQAFIQTTATARAQNGAEAARLESSLEMLKANQGNLDAARSRLEDVDVALESTNLAKQNILVQSAAAMLAQANASQNIALQLLG